MKFLHLSTGDVRGAFAGAYRLHRNLLAAGHESRMLVGDRRSDDPTVVAPARWRQAWGRFAQRAANQVFKRVCGHDTQVAHHLAINTSLAPADALVQALGGFEPDLVVAYYTSGFLAPDTLRALQARLRAPVALYLMDMEMLTGGCHYAWDCQGYLADCGHCPPARVAPLRHLVRAQWSRRRAAFDAMEPVVVTGSGWLTRQAAASGLTRGFARRQVLMGIDPERYAPGDVAALRQRFGLPGEATVLYFGAQNLRDPRKGFPQLRAALQGLAARLAAPEQPGVVLFTVGRLEERHREELARALPFRHVHLPYISEPALFASTYAAADLFICPSLEDSGPMMINESIMSGTPVAAFEMGVAVDLVQDGVTGLRVPLGDAGALADALAAFIRMPSVQRAAMRAACRALGLERSSAQAQVDAFVALARELRGPLSQRQGL